MPRASTLETPPGSAWNYNDGNTVILSHLIRNAAGGKAADMLRFAQTELFAPLGMRNVTIEFDASGNAEGSSQMLATARDWARFGQLYLNDGVVGGKRILPEGWVKYSASPTPNAWVGMGAGFWTNLGDSLGANYRSEHGWPRDAFFAKGTIGQYVIIIPSEKLVIVRLGRSPNWPPEADGVFRLVATSSRRPATRRKWRAAIECSSFSPCGRRWREAPDEGSLSANIKARGSHAERYPSPVSVLRDDPPSPTRGEGNTADVALAQPTAGPAASPSRRDRIAPATGSRPQAGRRGHSAPGGRA